MTEKVIIGLVAVLVVCVALGCALAVACYNWCPYGSSLYVTRKTGESSRAGQYAQPGQKGVEEQMRGPGRHFINPWSYSTTVTKDIRVLPGQIAVVKNNVGEPLEQGKRLAKKGQKGTLRNVLTPGIWRINPFGQSVGYRPDDSSTSFKTVQATKIEPGYVGVQISLAGETRDILPDILQAGYYNIHPLETRIKTVEIGYRVWETYTRPTQLGKPTVGPGVTFPLADGKEMRLDMTVVWGIFPEDAPNIVRDYGTVEMLEKKIIEPQILSICKNAGSNRTTKEFIQGETRKKFQDEVTKSLQDFGEKKGIHFLIALVRGFHPDIAVKKAIQDRMITEEEKTTLKFEEDRDTVAATLEKATRRVEVAKRDFDAETIALVQEEMELGRKKAAETVAEADRTVASLARQTAEIQAKIVKLLGQADATVIQAIKEAEATKLQLLVKAYGGADQYNLATFAESLPIGIQIEYRYAGPGTFWTDAKSTLSDLAVKKILDQSRIPAPEKK